MQRLTGEPLLAALRRLLAEGATLREAAARLRTPKSTLADLADRYHLPRRRRCLAPEKRRRLKRLLAGKKTDRQIAEEVPVSTETVWRYRHQIGKFRSLISRARNPMPCEDWRCPIGGELLNRTYCVAHKCHKPPRRYARTGKAQRS